MMNGINKEHKLLIDERKASIKLMVFLLPIPVMLGFLLLKVGWSHFYVFIVQEDSFVECAEFFIYVGALILAIFAGLGYLKKRHVLNGCLLFLLAFCLMFVSMEEISWGQRIFKLNTPRFFQQYNFQGEISIHNLKPVQDKLILLNVLFGYLFSFGWIPAKYISSIRGLRDDVKTAIMLFSPKWYLMLFFIPTTLIYSYFLFFPDHVEKGNFVIWRDQEPAELMLALGFLLFVTDAIIRLRYTINRKDL